MTGYATEAHPRNRYNPAIGELLETARERAADCTDDPPKPPDDCLSWLGQVLR